MRKRSDTFVAILVVLIAGLSSFGWFWDRRLKVEAQERERHFIAVRFLAVDSQISCDPVRPKDLDELLQHFGGTNSALLDPFPHGLEFSPTPSGYRLEEAMPAPVGLFESDRLISTDELWPRWESSGVLATKGDWQELPSP